MEKVFKSFNSLTGVINIAEKYLKKGDLISFQFLN